MTNRISMTNRMTNTEADTVSEAAVTSPAPTAKQTAARPRRARLRDERVLLLLGLPGILVVLVFSYLPLLGNVIAFKDYQPFLGISQSPWVGVSNFSILFNGDSAFLHALLNTLEISALQVFFAFPAPICIALMLNSLVSERFKNFVQSVLYLPHFLSWVIVVALFQQMLGNAGLASTFLQHHGHAGLHLIGNASTFKELLTAQVIWKDAGWGTILFLAALSRIDLHLYEASAVDGASRWRQLWHVTLPGIRPVIILLLILRLGDVLSVGFEQIVLQQQAVGAQASEVLDTYVYNNGILAGNWGVAAAVGLVKGLLGVVLVLGANKAAHLFGERGIYES